MRLVSWLRDWGYVVTRTDYQDRRAMLRTLRRIRALDTVEVQREAGNYLADLW